MAIDRVLCGNNCVVNDSVLLDDCVGYNRLRDAILSTTILGLVSLKVSLQLCMARMGLFACLLVEESQCAIFATLVISNHPITTVVSLLTSLMDQQVSARLHLHANFIQKLMCVK